MTATNVYLIETSGPRRQVFGPFTYTAAREREGNRCALVTGRNLANNQIINTGDLRTLVAIGAIVPIDKILLA